MFVILGNQVLCLNLIYNSVAAWDVKRPISTRYVRVQVCIFVTRSFLWKLIKHFPWNVDIARRNKSTKRDWRSALRFTVEKQKGNKIMPGYGVEVAHFGLSLFGNGRRGEHLTTPSTPSLSRKNLNGWDWNGWSSVDSNKVLLIKESQSFRTVLFSDIVFVRIFLSLKLVLVPWPRGI